MKNFEIELRYEIADTTSLNEFLKGLTFVSEKKVVDCYFDTSDGVLLQRGIYIRRRNDKKIDIKFNRACLEDQNLEKQDYCEEYSFQLPFQKSDLKKLNDVSFDLGLQTISTPDWHEYMSKNNLLEHRVVNKLRRTYTLEKFTVVIDQVKDLGTFIEIEYVAENISQLDAIKKEMLALLSGLTLKSLGCGYDMLVLRKQNFEQYLKGRYILEEDRELLL